MPTLKIKENGKWIDLPYTVKIIQGEQAGGIIPEGNLYISTNGDYDVKNYATVSVNVEPNLIEKEITASGTYSASDDGVDGYSVVKVEVSSGATKGILWTETNNLGRPIKVDASTVITTNNLFRYGDYVDTEEIILPNRVLNTYYMCYGNAKLKKINLPTESQYFSGLKIDGNAFMGCKLLTLSDWQIPEGIKEIVQSAFESAESLTDRVFPYSIVSIQTKAFNRCTSMKKVTFLGYPSAIANNAFANCTNLTDIYCPWVEGLVANAPWGATNATIHYNYTQEV